MLNISMIDSNNNSTSYYFPYIFLSRSCTIITLETKKMEAISFQDILEPFHSRKLFYFPAYHHPPQAESTPPSSHDHLTRSTTLKSTLDANVIMVVSVLLLALICSFCLNSMIRCALRCSTFISSDNSNRESLTGARLPNTGIKKQALKTFPVVNYSGEMKFPGLECVICLSDFAPGERIRVLPECDHRFHVNCIDRWLNSHSSCPTCRHSLIETTTSQKTSAPETLVVSSVTPPPPGPPQESRVVIAPLEPEGFIGNHHS